MLTAAPWTWVRMGSRLVLRDRPPQEASATSMGRKATHGRGVAMNDKKATEVNTSVIWD